MSTRGIASLLFLLAAPAMASACSGCVFQSVGEVLPPVYHWSVIGLVLYPVVALGLRPIPSKEWLHPFNGPTAIMVVVVGFLAGVFPLGPIPFLVMLVLGLWGLGVALARPAGKGRARIAAEWALAVATIVALTITAITMWAATT